MENGGRVSIQEAPGIFLFRLSSSQVSFYLVGFELGRSCLSTSCVIPFEKKAAGVVW